MLIDIKRMGNRVFITLPIRGEPFQRIGLVRLLLVVFVFILGPYFSSHRGALVFREHSFADQFHLVDFKGGRVVSNASVGLGLGNGRVVLGIVTVSTIADDVDHAVSSERLTPLSGQSTHSYYSIDIVTIDMKDRGTHTFGHTKEELREGRQGYKS